MKHLIRFVRGIGALGILLGTIGGVPILLLQIGRLPAITPFPEMLLVPDQGALLLGVLTVLGWAAWAIFTVSVLAELVVLLSGRRIRVRLPGLTAPRNLAAGLLLAIAAMGPIAAHAAPAHAAPVASAPMVAPDQPLADQPAQELREVRFESGLRYTIQRGDDLWSLAERFYGDGMAWHKIVAANPGITDPNRIDHGWEIVLPGVADPAASADQTRSAEGADSAEPADAQPSWEAPTLPPPPAAAPPGTAAPAKAPTTAEASSEQLAAPIDRIAYATAGISSITAASLLALLAFRREAQLAGRPIGRRIVHPAVRSQRLEAALGQAQDPLTLRTLDLALRALGRHYRAVGASLPGLGEILVTDDRISFEVDRIPRQLPPGFHADSRRLWIGVPEGDWLHTQVDALMAEPVPYPTVVCLGETEEGAVLLYDLETVGMLGLTGDRAVVSGALKALTLELASTWWGRGQQITVVAGDDELVEALDQPEVRVREDLAEVLAELETAPQRARDHPRDLRSDPDLEDAWRPHILLIGRRLTHAERHRIGQLVMRSHLVVVAADESLPNVELAQPPEFSILPSERTFRAQVMSTATRDQLVGLLVATAEGSSTPAPWWNDDATLLPFAPGPVAEPEPIDHEAGITTRLSRPSPRSEPAPKRGNVISLAARRAAVTDEEPAAMDAHEPVLHPDPDHPTVLLCGPVGLVGARGEQPSRAVRQCIEYAAWLLEHPGSTSTMMATALFVAEPTRRSNMSRLRSWLGSDLDGELYLPEAYSGRIHLHPGVTSDWNRIQLLTIGGVNRVADTNLITVLEMVRGAPLADAAPGQWHWAEELRTDISSLVRDVGLVLCERALERHEIDLARWATNRALVAAPEDEYLLAARVRAEHRAGNRSEVERLVLRLVRSARRLNIDLADDTVTLLQEVMEGNPRSRTIS